MNFFLGGTAFPNLINDKTQTEGIFVILAQAGIQKQHRAKRANIDAARDERTQFPPARE